MSGFGSVAGGRCARGRFSAPSVGTLEPSSAGRFKVKTMVRGSANWEPNYVLALMKAYYEVAGKDPKMSTQQLLGCAQAHNNKRGRQRQSILVLEYELYLLSLSSVS